MTELLIKSEQNQKAALRLHDPLGFYASSVHCAYYSCIQLMIHILITAGKKTEAEIDLAIKTQGRSHHYYITEVTRLIQQRDGGKVKGFGKIKDLKDFRKKSDYKNVPITKDDSDKATTLSQSITGLLKSVFKI